MWIRKIATLLILSLCALQSLSFDLKEQTKLYQGANFELSKIYESSYEDAPAIFIDFTVPVDMKSIEDNISVNNTLYNTWILSENRKRIILSFVTPNKQYAIEVKDNIKSIFNEKVKSRVLQKATAVNKNSEFDFYKKLTTKSLSPKAEFSSNGAILSKDNRKSLPLEVINVSKVEVDFFKIDSDKVHNVINEFAVGEQRYHQLNYLKNYGQLVHTAGFEFDLIENQTTKVNLDLSNIEALSDNALYAAVLRNSGEYEYRYQFSYFVISRLGLHLRKYNQQSELFVQDINTGFPIEGAKITVYDHKNNPKQLVSDASGKVTLEQSNFKYLLAKSGNSFSYLMNSNSNILDLSAFRNPISIHNELQAFVWGERDLYRSGEKVQLNLLLKDMDGLPVQSFPVLAQVVDSSGNKFPVNQVNIQQNSQHSSGNLYQFEYTILDSAKTGEYYFQFLVNSKVIKKHKIKVEDFLPERMKLSLYSDSPENKEYMRDVAKFSIPVKGDYLYGAPASNNDVQALITSQINLEPFEKLKEYRFGDKNEIKQKVSNQRTLKSAKIKLDDNGETIIELANPYKDVTSPMMHSVKVSLFETGGRPVSRSVDLIQLNSNLYIGIKALFEGRADYNSAAKFEVIAVNKHGVRVDAKDVELTLTDLYRNWYRTHTSSTGWQWKYDVSREIVFTKNIDISKSGDNHISVPVHWGQYELSLKNNSAQTAIDFRAGWNWHNNINQSVFKPDMVSLNFDKDAYKANDQAVLQIQATKFGHALVSIENTDGILHSEYIEINKEQSTYEFTVSPSWKRHDIYATVMIIEKPDLTQTYVPTRAIGFVHLPLDRKNREQQVEILVDDKVEPNQSVSAIIKLRSQHWQDSHGSQNTLNLESLQNKRAIVTLVDQGILNITRYETPNPHAYFFAPRRFTTQLLDNYGLIIDNFVGENILQKFGGGFKKSNAQISKGGDQAKSDVQLLSYSSEVLTFDANGEAKVSFDIPNFNGQLTWSVVVFDEQNYGSTKKEMLVADKVVTQISMPRFLAFNDQSMISVDVHNLSGSDGEFEYKLSTSQGLSTKTISGVINLNDTQKDIIKLPIDSLSSNGTTGIIDFTFENESLGVDIKRQWKIALRHAYPAITQKQVFEIEVGEAFTPAIDLSDIIQDSAQFQLALSATPPINFQDHFGYLLRYPYGCLEQTVSSGSPWLYIDNQGFEQLDLKTHFSNRFKDQKYNKEFRLEQINKALKGIEPRQKTNGGFGLWSSNSSEAYWPSIYATAFLLEAKKQGANVSDEVLNKALNRLNEYLTKNTFNSYSEYPNHLKYSIQGYSAFVLVQAKKTSLSKVRNLYKKMQNVNDAQTNPLAMVYLASALKELGAHTEANNLVNNINFSGYLNKSKFYYGDYGSVVRDFSVIARLNNQYKFNLNTVLFDLNSYINNRRYLSTQERMQLVRLVTSLENNELFDFNIQTPKELIDINDQTAYNSVFNFEQYQSIEGIESATKLYGEIVMVAPTTKAPKQRTQDFNVQRSYFNVEGDSIDFASVESGDLVLVKVDINTDYRFADAMLIELLPAGFELENQNLENASVNMNQIKIAHENKVLTVQELMSKSISHSEYRDDRFVAALDVKSYGTNYVFYLMRAVTPGTYNVPTSYIEDMYRPDMYGINKNKYTKVEIKP